MKTSGIVNVYKEKGYTSFDVVAILRKTFHIKKVGHTGTLDPDAEGVLPVCFGKATKVCDLLTDKDKVYRAKMHLGITTDTEDITGNVTSESPVQCSEDEIRQVISSFVGDILQVPPMYSALKVNGKKLYELARAGVEVERKARSVKIFSIEIEEISLPYVTFLVHWTRLVLIWPTECLYAKEPISVHFARILVKNLDVERAWNHFLEQGFRVLIFRMP